MRRLFSFGLGAALLLEIGLRYGLGLGEPPLVVQDPQVEYRLVASTEYHRFGNRIAINRYGMRAQDHAPMKSGNERRVLLIGDSVVYGNHFIDQHDTIASQLQTLLQSERQCPVLVMPAAASSWGPVNQAAFLEDIGTLEADQAVLLVSAHDLYDTPTHQDAVIPYRLSPSFGAIGDAFEIVMERITPQTSDAPLASLEIRQAQSLEALDKMHRQLTQDKIPLTLVYHPTVQERTKPPQVAQGIFAAWAHRNDVAFLELRNGFTQDAYRDNIHPNASGAALIAARLSEQLSPALSPC